MSEYPPARIPGDNDPDGVNPGQLFSILRDATAVSSEKIAIVQGGRNLRYRDLYSGAELLAAKLAGAGIKVGDKVGLMASNGAMYIAMFFAVARIGAIVVPISRDSKLDEVADLADQTEMNAFCYSRNFAPLIRDGTLESSIEVAVLPDDEAVFIRRCADGKTFKAEHDRLAVGSVGMIRFSSGTTGKSKGVILSTPAILARAKTFSLAYSVDENCCMLHLLSAELATPTLLGCLLQRAQMVFEDVHRLESIAHLMRTHRVTHIHASPLFYRMMVGSDAITASDFRSVGYVVSTGAPLPIPVAQAFRDKFGREILQYYALAECGTVFASTTQDIQKRGSSGTLMPRCDAKLVKSTSSGASEVGELLVKSAGLFEGYYRPWSFRENILEGGWFKTGDVARRDAEGYYWIIGRTKDVINVGGVKVFPEEIEDVLLTHPTVDQAVVFSAPDDRFGEVPRAKVRLVRAGACTEKELIEFSNQKLSVFRRLRSIEIVEDLPKTLTGKLKRDG
jgi:long-chain acyl-CoA synthetase